MFRKTTFSGILNFTTIAKLTNMIVAIVNINLPDGLKVSVAAHEVRVGRATG